MTANKVISSLRVALGLTLLCAACALLYRCCTDIALGVKEGSVVLLSLRSPAGRLEFAAPGCSLRRLGGLACEEPAAIRELSSYNVLRGRVTVGRLELAMWRIRGSGTVLCFLSGQFRQPCALKLGLRLSSGQPMEVRMVEYPNGLLDNHRSRWSRKQPRLPFRLVPGLAFIETNGAYLCFGPVDVVQPLGRGVFRADPAQSAPLAASAWGRNGTEFESSLHCPAGCRLRTWFMVSAQPLVDWRDDAQAGAVLVADFNRFRKLWPDGEYDLVPADYIPSDRWGYWRCPAQHAGLLLLERAAGCPFGRAVATFLMCSAVGSQGADGWWPTLPQSGWLSRDYDIGPGFYDTRFNTDVALFLLRAFEAFSERGALKSSLRYASFLCFYAEQHALRTDGGGWLVPDYMDPSSGRAPTHTSLNHQLAEMNYLYKCYLATGDSIWLEAAQRLRRGLKDTRDGWFKLDGDLWYCRFPDGRYGLPDYPTLTLDDFRQTQDLIACLEGRGDPDFDVLIAAKERALSAR